MDIILNGKPCSVESGLTAAALLVQKGYKSKTSVWVNGRQLLLAEYASYIIEEGDKVKLLRIIGGG